MSIPNPIPEPVVLDRVLGDDTGIVMAAHAKALEQDGAAWLTQAFQRFGSIGTDNAVARIVRFDRCSGGSTGAKYLLDVEWAHPDPSLDTALFVKFSRDFEDRRRDHPGRYEMAAEAPFMALARLEGFPVSVATPYFADYAMESGTGLVITQRVPYGDGVIEPHREKALDFLTLDDPLLYYKATLTGLARLAGRHKSGALSTEIDARFPFDPNAGSADLMRNDRQGLMKNLARTQGFVAACPQYFSEQVRDLKFLDQMCADAQFIFDHEQQIRAYLIRDTSFIALNHWNAHIDNAFFWRADDGLHCGFIDWGRVGLMTLSSALWGALSAAHFDIWSKHLDELLALFVDEYHAAGGPKISGTDLEQHLLVHIGLMGVARIFALSEYIEYREPQVRAKSGLRDPDILSNEPARNCLHIMKVFLDLWQARGIGAHVRDVVAREDVPSSA